MNPDWLPALERVGGEPVARLATVRAGGSPHLVPITFAMEGELIYTMVDEKPKTTTSLRRLANIEANPAVSLLVDHYDDDWSRLWWVRIDGVGGVETDESVLSEAKRALSQKYPQYVESPPGGPAIVITVANVRWWESTPGSRPP